MASEARMSEEKAQRAMVDAARLADELRVEQDLAVGLERERKVLSCNQCKFWFLSLLSDIKLSNT